MLAGVSKELELFAKENKIIVVFALQQNDKGEVAGSKAICNPTQISFVIKPVPLIGDNKKVKNEISVGKTRFGNISPISVIGVKLTGQIHEMEDL